MRVPVAFSLVLASCIATPAAAPAAGTERITILYDAFGRAPEMTQDWGYAALVQAEGRRILFDTGNDADVFARNVAARAVDLASLDFVVISHRHGDHMGGLAHLLRVNPSVQIYAPNDGAGGVFGTELPAAFLGKDTTLTPERRYFDGAPPDVVRLGSAWPRANIEIVDRTSEIAPGIHLLALESDAPGTKELRELSLAIDTTDGLILIVGCSHAGIVRIVEAAASIQPRIRLVAGGMHLVKTPEPEIEAIATRLREEFRVGRVAPGHCTGEPAFAAFARAFAGRYLYAGLGTTVDVPRP